MKRILLCTDGSAFAQCSYLYAAWFASRLDAAVDVLHVTDVRGQARAASANLSGSIGVDASDLLLQKLVDLEHEKARLSHQQAKMILQGAAITLQAEGVREIQIMHKTGFLVDLLPELEAAADWIILGKRGESAEFASGHLGANLERIIRASHKPCLVTSQAFQPINRVLLAYDGSSISQKALQLLLTSPAFAGLELYLINVAKAATDATAQSRLHAAQEQAQAAGLTPSCEIVVGNPESAIAQYISTHEIDLLMIGAYGHSRIRHLVIGSTTAQILRKVQIPILVVR